MNSWDFAFLEKTRGPADRFLRSFPPRRASPARRRGGHRLHRGPGRALRAERLRGLAGVVPGLPVDGVGGFFRGGTPWGGMLTIIICIYVYIYIYINIYVCITMEQNNFCGCSHFMKKAEKVDHGGGLNIYIYIYIYIHTYVHNTKLLWVICEPPPTPIPSHLDDLTLVRKSVQDHRAQAMHGLCVS